MNEFLTLQHGALQFTNFFANLIATPLFDLFFYPWNSSFPQLLLLYLREMLISLPLWAPEGFLPARRRKSQVSWTVAFTYVLHKQQFRFYNNVLRRYELCSELLQDFLAMQKCECLIRRLVVQLFPLVRIYVIYHQLNVSLLRQAVKTRPLRQNPANKFMIVLYRALLKRGRRVAVENVRPPVAFFVA